jgi:uncharacterized protein
MQDPITYDPDKRKFLSALCHGSIFLSTIIFPIVIPIAILFVSDDPVVKANAKEAINFYLNVWFWGGVIGALTFLTFGLLGFVLVPIGYVWHWGMTIWAVWHSLNAPNDPFRYPFVFRVL